MLDKINSMENLKPQGQGRVNGTSQLKNPYLQYAGAEEQNAEPAACLWLHLLDGAHGRLEEKPLPGQWIT